MLQQDLDDAKNTVERAFKAAIFSMDYCILRVILDASKETQKACENKDHQSALYFSYKDFGISEFAFKEKLKTIPVYRLTF